MRLKELRKKKNLSQTEFANKLGMNRLTYNKQELGINQPDIPTLIKYADFYNVTVDYLIGHDENNTKQKYTDDQEELIEMLTKLNQLNFVKAYSYIAGLYASQN